MRDDRRALLTVGAWLAGVAWILIPHPFEGRILFIISHHFGLGVHLTDPIGVIVPLLVTVLLFRRHLRRWSATDSKRYGSMIGKNRSN